MTPAAIMIRALVGGALLCMPFSSDAGAGNVFTVGGDIGCDHTDIQDAINAAATSGFAWTHVRIARSQSYSGVAIDVNTPMIVSGGYDNCSDSTPSGRTVINGFGSTADAVVDISGTAQVTLQNLSISGGDPSAGNLGGGIQILGNNQVSLQNVTVSNNQSDRGAGIYIDGGVGATLTVDEDSSIFSNTANLTGGGIHCVNMVEPQFVRIESDMFNNEAINGGGVYLDNCSFIQVAMSTGDGIFFNQATGSGGGAYLTNNASIILDGDPEALSVVSINSAAVDGGGLYVTGNSRVIGFGAQLIDNTAGGNGGAVYQANGSVSFNGFGKICALPRCSRIEQNRADGQGGAFYKLDGELSIRNSWLVGNSSPDGSLIKSEGGSAFFSNAIIARNRDATAVMRLKNGDAEIYNTTMANNEDMIATLFLTGGSLTLKGSIIWETLGQAISFFGAPTTTTYNCLLVHNFPEPVMGTNIVFDDPMFVDPANDDYHLPMTSPAVDFCFNVLGPPIKGIVGPLFDLDGDQRGFDVDSVANNFGPFDLGADEWVDLIFDDGFEFQSAPIR